jgi:hypothetical protein
MSFGDAFGMQLPQNYETGFGLRLPPTRSAFDPFASLPGVDDWLSERISTIQLGNAPLISGMGVLPRPENATLVHDGLLLMTRGWERVVPDTGFGSDSFGGPRPRRDLASTNVFMLHSANALLRELCAEATEALERVANIVPARGLGGGVNRRVPESHLNLRYVFNDTWKDGAEANDVAAIPYVTAEGVFNQLRYVAPNGAQSNTLASNTADQPAFDLSAEAGTTTISPVLRGMTPVHNYWGHECAQSGQHLWLLIKRTYVGAGEIGEDGLYPEQTDQRDWSALQYVPHSSPDYAREVEPDVLPYLGYGGCAERAKPIYVGYLSMEEKHALVTADMVSMAAGMHTQTMPLRDLTRTASHAAAVNLNTINLMINPREGGDRALISV